MNLRASNVLHRMRRQGPGPLRHRSCVWRSGRTAVKEQIPMLIAADEVTGTQNIDCGGPSMSVHGHNLARFDADFQDSYTLVLEQNAMVIPCRAHRVQRIRPRPTMGHACFRVCTHCSLPTRSLAPAFKCCELSSAAK